jgi:S-adenosylmethionine:tRNA ribosyltransferase-isomerase
MRAALFEFDLPPERSALRPAEPRDAALLLIIRPLGSPRFKDRAVLDRPVFIPIGSPAISSTSPPPMPLG